MPAPGTVVEEQDQTTFIPTTKQALCAMAMVTLRGPIGRAQLVTSWPDFVRVFGGFIAGNVAQICAKTALDNGCQLLITRIVHYTDVTDASTRTSAAAQVTLTDRAGLPTHGKSTGTAAFPLHGLPGGTLVVSINSGGDATATFRATRATMTGSGATYAAVTASHKITVAVNGINRVVTFAGSENTQALFLAALNDQLPGASAVNAGGQVKLQTDRYGSTAAIAVVSGDTDALASLGLSVASGTNAGPNDVADSDAITITEFTTIVQAAVSGCTAGADGSNHPYIQSNTTGTGSTVQVKSGSTLDDVLGFDNTSHAGSASGGVDTVRLTASSDGLWGNGLRAVVDDDPGDPATRFRLRLTDASGRVLETYSGLSMTASDPAYIVNALRDANASVLAEDLASATVAPGNRPANGTVALAGGLDGTSGIVQDDWIGDADALTGLHALDTERGFRLLSLPGVTDFDTLAAADAYCALSHRQDVALVASVLLSSDHLDAIAWRRRTSPYSGVAIDSNRSALYFGWHEVLDPVTKQPIMIPIDGEVFAAFARANVRGAWIAAAGPQRGKLSVGVRKLKQDLSKPQMDALFDAGINPVYKDAKFGFMINGQRDLQMADSALARLNVRLLVDFIRESVTDATRIYSEEPNDPTLWRNLRDITVPFMDELVAKEALEGYRVVSDETNNTAPERAARRTHLDLYVTPIEASEELHIGIILVPPGTDLSS